MARAPVTRASEAGTANARKPASAAAGKPPSQVAVAPLPAAGVPDDAVVVGRVAGSYGVRGALRVEPFNDPRDSVLSRARRWYLLAPAPVPTGVAAPGASRIARPFALPALLEVSRCRIHGASLIAGVAGIEVKEVADALRGCEVAVSRADFPAPDDDEYYWVDLIGCAVRTPDGVDLGVVEEVDDHGAHPLLRLRGADGRERLIPFVSAHVSEVDISGRRIVADWDPDF